MIFSLQITQLYQEWKLIGKDFFLLLCRMHQTVWLIHENVIQRSFVPKILMKIRWRIIVVLVCFVLTS